MNLGIVKHKNMIKYTIINKWEALIEKLNDYIHCQEHLMLLMSWIGTKRIFKVITQKAFILLFTNTQTGNTKFQFQQQLIFM